MSQKAESGASSQRFSWHTGGSQTRDRDRICPWFPSTIRSCRPKILSRICWDWWGTEMPAWHETKLSHFWGKGNLLCWIYFCLRGERKSTEVGSRKAATSLSRSFRKHNTFITLLPETTWTKEVKQRAKTTGWDKMRVCLFWCKVWIGFQIPGNFSRWRYKQYWYR